MKARNSQALKTRRPRTKRLRMAARSPSVRNSATTPAATRIGRSTCAAGLLQAAFLLERGDVGGRDLHRHRLRVAAADRVLFGIHAAGGPGPGDLGLLLLAAAPRDH